MNEPKKPEKEEFKFESSRRQKAEKIDKLTDYREGYSIETFMKDLESYFDNEVDFNLAKIRQEVEAPGCLSQLIEKAKEKNTHPVTEFVQKLFEDLGQSGDVEWSGKW